MQFSQIQPYLIAFLAIVAIAVIAWILTLPEFRLGARIVAKAQAWALSKGGWSHAIAGIFGSAIVAYFACQPFHDLVLKVYALIPAWADSWILLLVGWYAWYHHASSPAGTMARARAIAANGNTPTTAQVDAADVAIK